MSELLSMFQIDSGHPWWHFVVRAALVYAFLLVAMRLLGNRPMAQMNKFDVILLMVLANAVQNAMNAGDNSVLAGLLLAITLMALFVLYLDGERVLAQARRLMADLRLTAARRQRAGPGVTRGPGTAGGGARDPQGDAARGHPPHRDRASATTHRPADAAGWLSAAHGNH